MAARQQPEWPVLTHYDQEHLARIALPLGGIGTGTVSLGGYGDLRDWEVMNRPQRLLLDYRHKQAFLGMSPLGFNWLRRRIWGFLQESLELS